ncbi:aspartate/glutamate racemase family protein [Azospirillum sp. B506]|uniref:aspartate/glutamate racemase family protein n=1 Tax=Azospirillum sp. B506 TaxID=137721 RepID=UPI00034CD3C6|nr:aspartate/glutamate racemase family protein [Azospirillum sp. B506]
MARPLGIIMLDTAFERPVGDVGNAGSWPFPVLYRTVSGALPRDVVDGREGGLMDAFVAAGEELIRQGAAALLTSCGFLVLRQRPLAARLSRPLATSSLLQLPQIAAMLPAGRTIGVVTYDAGSLTPAHFHEAGLTETSGLPPVAGLPRGGAFHRLIEKNEPYDRPRLEAELMAAVEELVRREPAIGAILLECTNLPPFSAAIAARFGLPVFDVLTLGRWLHAGIPAG